MPASPPLTGKSLPTPTFLIVTVAGSIPGGSPPGIVPYRVIPNEMDVLVQLAKGSGMALRFDNNAKSFIKDGTLKSSKITSSIARDVALLANRKKTTEEFTNNFISLLTE